MRRLIAILAFVSCGLFANKGNIMEGYSTAPLAEPIFDVSEVMVDSAAFSSWLNANYSKLNSETMKGPREHLYYLLSSYVSEIYRKDGVVLPKQYDLVLETLFSWSERLGVYGGHLFYNKFKRTELPDMPELVELPKGISISALNDMYEIQSNDGAWRFTVPYYFMIGIINEFTATNGMNTHLLSISTGGVKDKTTAGRSQSTLMFIYSPTNDKPEFERYWLSRFEVGDDITPAPLHEKMSLESFYVNKDKSLLHKEIVFVPAERGCYLVAYLGMDGAYQTNRPHFLDFVSNLRIHDGSR